jgi:hypothetical protein
MQIRIPILHITWVRIPHAKQVPDPFPIGLLRLGSRIQARPQTNTDYGIFASGTGILEFQSEEQDPEQDQKLLSPD